MRDRVRAVPRGPVSSDPAAEYRADVYRMGYCGGKGGRLMRSLGPTSGVRGHGDEARRVARLVRWEFP